MYAFSKHSRGHFAFYPIWGFDLDNSIEMLEGIEKVSVLNVQTELMKKKLLYLKIANEIGNQFGGVT